jgi:hypothetical protein
MFSDNNKHLLRILGGMLSGLQSLRDIPAQPSSTYSVFSPQQIPLQFLVDCSLLTSLRRREIGEKPTKSLANSSKDGSRLVIISCIKQENSFFFLSFGFRYRQQAVLQGECGNVRKEAVHRPVSKGLKNMSKPAP